MKPLEDTLRQQDKLKPPYGECHLCHDMGHQIGECLEVKKLREQHMSTNKKLHMDNVVSVDLQIIECQIVI